MKRHYGEENASETADGASVEGGSDAVVDSAQPSQFDVGASTPLAPGETTVRGVSSDRCNAGEPDSRQQRKSTTAANESPVAANVDDATPAKKIEPEPWAGRNWDDLLRGARQKYSTERIGAPPPERKEPTLAEGVYSRWRLEKAEFGIPTSMAITSKGCVVVAEYGQSCLEFYDDGGTLTHKMEGVKPFSVVVNDKDQVRHRTCEIVVHKKH